jgi:menaquinone-dependent protoporphyrinogen oxidase
MMKSLTRREFMVNGSMLIGGAVGGLALGNELFFPKKAQAAKVEFPESICGLERKTGKKVLVTYASKYGSSGGVADAIGKELCTKGVNADVVLIKNTSNVGSYQGVVIGSAIYMGKWMSEAVNFVKKNQDILRQMPVAYFLVCMTLSQPTEKNRAQVLSYMDPILKAVPEIKPVGIGTFAGALDYSNLSWLKKTIMKSKGAPEGDFRDWTAVRTWAEGLCSSLLASGGKRYAAR